MAIYHLHAKTHSRGTGKGAGGHARYVLREGPYAEKRVEVVDGATVRREKVSRADEVVFAVSDHMPAWAMEDARSYWDAADQFERANGTVYREIEFALPEELSVAQNVVLATGFAESLAEVPGGATPYTLAIHRSEKHPDLLHCHLMLSDKVNDGIARDAALWFRRAANVGKDPARGGAPKTQVRIGQEWLGGVVRPLWEQQANDALERAGVAARIDRRTLDAQRIEQEQQAVVLTENGQLKEAATARENADALDRPPEPKKGRVLTHAGAEAAPGRAALVEDFEAARAARARAVEARREAEEAAARERQAVVQAQAVLDAARARQMQRDAFAAKGIRERWRKRQQARVDRVLDTEALAEERNGIRAGDRPAWAAYRERVLTEAYGQEVARVLGRWVRVERDRGSRALGRAPSLHMHNKALDITDYGDRLVAAQGNDREIATMLQLAQAKGWKTLDLTGSEDFRMQAGAAALAAGFTLSDGDLAGRIAARQEAEAQAQQDKDLEAAPVLAEWMRAHPKQAQAQRLAGGKLPWAYPAGLDRAALQRPEVWAAAEAWTVGRYGETAAWRDLSRDADPLKAQAADAGREAALNAWAQEGITLRVGRDAPPGAGGLEMSRTVEITRPQVEQWAQQIHERQKRSGARMPIAVTFGRNVTVAKKVLVLEHLLRQSVPVNGQALEAVGEGAVWDDAQKRLRTHEADGRQQAWYTRDLERKAVRRKREAAESRLDALVDQLVQQGSADAGRLFQEAGFVVDKDGGYTYPYPDLPGVKKAWDALARVQRQELEADLQRRAESMGYRLESAQLTTAQRKADPEFRGLVQETHADQGLRAMANDAYRQGINRAQQEREERHAQARSALLKTARNLGYKMEQGGSVTQQAEWQKEFAAAVQLGGQLGVDEKALGKSLQGGREAYRQTLARSRGRGMEL